MIIHWQNLVGLPRLVTFLGALSAVFGHLNNSSVTMREPDVFAKSNIAALTFPIVLAGGSANPTEFLDI